MTHLFFSFFFFNTERTASVDNVITIFVQPEIVSTGEGLELDKTYVAFKVMALCSFPQQCIADIVLALLLSL